MKNELQFLLYSTPEENITIQAVVKDETSWLTQKAMAELFDCSSDSISLHLKNIYKDGELMEESTTEKISVVQKEENRNVNRISTFYNLDAIISVGYRVNSSKATKFRIWATGIPKVESDFDKAIKQIEQKHDPTIRNFRKVQKDGADE